MRISATFALLALSLPAGAASVNVKPGDDLRALTQSLNPGDVVTFSDGLYELDGTLRWTAPGEEGNPISLKAIEGATPVLRNIAGGYVAELNDSSYVTVKGLTFEGGDDWEETRPSGFRVANGSHVTVSDCVVRNVWGTGMRIDGDSVDLRIERNLIDNTGEGSGIYTGCSDGSCWMQDSVVTNNLVRNLLGDYRYGIYLSPGAQGNEVTDNVLYNLADIGMHVDTTQFGEANLVERNLIWTTGDHGIEVFGAARVRNNIIVDTLGYGVFSRSPNDDQLTDVVITYNTIANTGNYGLRLEDWFNGDQLVLSSNVVANPIGRGLYFEIPEGEIPTPYITNNWITGYVEGVDRALYDWFEPGAGLSDFVDPDNLDFYPLQTSPLLNTGDPLSEAWVPQVDFNGAARDGASPDVGAYEWDGQTNPGWVLQDDFKGFDLDEGGGSYDVSSGCCKKNADNQSSLIFLPLLGLLALRRREA